MTLATLRLVVDFGLLVLIWLVQLIIYPSFRYCAEEHLCGWHARYTRRIGYIVMPLMLAQVAIIGAQVYAAATLPAILAAVLVVLVWAATFFQAVPLHSQIAAGEDTADAISTLITANWARTAVWTCIFVLGLFTL